jgi:cytochrome c553
MLHIISLHNKTKIAANLALVILITTSITVTAATVKDDKNAANKAQAVVAVPVNPEILKGQTFADNSAESIKLRSGSGNAVAGKDKSLLCQGCHGEEGLSIEPLIPRLAGQYAGYIGKQIHDFQTGYRSNAIMNGMAATVDEADLADITAYFASRAKMKGDGISNPLGKSLFQNGDMSRMMVACVNCHGINGKGKTQENSMFPVLGGLQKDYLRGQLVSFRQGERSNSPGGVMNIVAQKLTNAEIDALAEYLSGL